ncbi:hypothetical protein GCM10009865_35480 [Aeromicrobium ponti]|uniref:Type IV pilus assembly protein PilA n=2 Tax=Cytobacillus oceanisediminis TaxID=665099 RepID=A0A562JNR7_9BACI|nr:type II secretion system protein [Cytobacillus oceanisediminis]TWH84809.1 type IV pilus assembly protein PilA [Cytobacillus oceanisediminis]
MFKRIRNYFKNQKGLTLVELLAVIVILGIIAAIAVPSIGKIMENSKKDAHVSNAQQILGAAKLAVASKDPISTGTDNTMTLGELHTAGFIEEIPVSPKTNVAYDSTTSKVVIDTTATGGFLYKVTLVDSGNTVINGETAQSLAKAGRDLVSE